MKQWRWQIIRCLGVALCAFLFLSCRGAENELIKNSSTEEKVGEVSLPFHEGNGSEMRETVLGNPGNMINEGYICESDGYIYFSTANGLYKDVTDGDGSNKKFLVEEKDRCREVCVNGDYVYYISGARIKCVGKDGGQAILLTEEPAVYMQMTEEKIYFVCNGVYSMNLDGSGLELLTKKGITDETVSDLIWVNVYGDYVLYVAPEEDFSLYAVKKDGSDVYKIAEYVNFPVVNGDVIYYQGKEEKILELSFISGKTREVSTSHQIRPVIFKNKIYSTDWFSIYCYSIENNEEKCAYSVGGDYDNELEQLIDLFWVTSNRIYFMSAATGTENTLNYIDCLTGQIGFLK